MTISKSLIAHELGHVITAYWKDSKYYPIGMTLMPCIGMLAYTEFEVRKKVRALIGRYAKINDICVLGGVFGELLYQNSWSPWGVRADIDEFLCENSKSTSKLKYELENWLWISTDSPSFHRVSSLSNFRTRRAIKYNVLDTQNHFPRLWSVYSEFCHDVDAFEFLKIIDEIYKSGIAVYEEDELLSFAKRCLNEVSKADC